MKDLQLQPRGTGGEHTAAVDDVYDISNRARLKKSEVLYLPCRIIPETYNAPIAMRTQTIGALYKSQPNDKIRRKHKNQQKC